MSTFSLLSEDHLQDLYEFHTLWMTSCRDSTTSHIQQACSQGPLTIRPPICQYVSKHEAGACDWLIFMEEPRRRKKPETDQSMLIIEISCGDFPSFMQQPFDNDQDDLCPCVTQQGPIRNLIWLKCEGTLRDSFFSPAADESCCSSWDSHQRSSSFPDSVIFPRAVSLKLVKSIVWYDQRTTQQLRPTMFS